MPPLDVAGAFLGPSAEVFWPVEGMEEHGESAARAKFPAK